MPSCRNDRHVATTPCVLPRPRRTACTYNTRVLPRPRRIVSTAIGPYTIYCNYIVASKHLYLHSRRYSFPVIPLISAFRILLYLPCGTVCTIWDILYIQRIVLYIFLENGFFLKHKKGKEKKFHIYFESFFSQMSEFFPFLDVFLFFGRFCAQLERFFLLRTFFSRKETFF